MSKSKLDEILDNCIFEQHEDNCTMQDYKKAKAELLTLLIQAAPKEKKASFDDKYKLMYAGIYNQSIKDYQENIRKAFK